MGRTPSPETSRESCDPWLTTWASWRYSNVAILRCAPLGNNSRTHQAMAIAHHLLFLVEAVPHLFPPSSTRLTWAYPKHYTSALAFSVIPMLRLLGLPYG